MLVRMWNDGDSDSALVGMQNGIATLENNLALLQSLRSLTVYLIVMFPDSYSNELKTCQHKNLHMNVYSSFIDKLPKLGAN